MKKDSLTQTIFKMTHKLGHFKNCLGQAIFFVNFILHLTKLTNKIHDPIYGTYDPL